MGNCCRRCFGRSDKRSYLRTHYNVAREMSVEFENLVDSDANAGDIPQYGTSMTDYERHLLSERKFHDIVQYQIKIDAEIEAQLMKQEEQIRQEEEAFYEAKRLATQANVRHSASATQKKPSESWAPDDNWEMATGEDFEKFLASIREKTRRNKAKEAENEDVQGTDVESDKLGQSSTQPDLLAVTSDAASPSTADKQAIDDVEWNAEFISADSEN